MPVEPGEAECRLDVLGALFDFSSVRPDAARRRREALNAERQSAGTPPMK